MKANDKDLFEQHKDDYSEIIPLFIYPNEQQSKALYPDMDKVIDKCAVVIDRHSIYVKKEEHNKWIDDSYMLIGKARFYKQEYYSATEIFEYIVKAYKKKPEKFDALIWLIRTNMELNDMDKAEAYLNVVESGKAVPKKYKSEYNAIYADFYLRKNNTKDAIDKLTTALETTKSKKKKRRYSYVLAQLWLKKKEYTQASKYFAQVIKLKPRYDMMFNARISQALSYDVASEDKDKVKKMLRKMVKDVKNEEFLDQIYYVLADISFKEGQEPLGINYLKKSAAASVSNNKQKALSYLKLGEIYYSKPKYILAESYYDSCLTVLPKEYKNYDNIYERKKALTRLVTNLKIIEHEDSLQLLAGDETLRNETIEKLIAKAVEEERLKKEEEENLADGSLPSQNSTSPTVNGPANTSWYFYNPNILGFGFSDFKQNWGTRQLADDWRRKNKQTVASFDQDEEEIDSLSKDSVIANKFTDPNYYLKEIPLTPEKMNISHNMVIEAFYAAGNIYREDFMDYERSIKSFKELISRYDTCRYVLPSWYNLYRISLLIDDDQMKEKYANLIIGNYPESEYAKIIQDPSYNKVTRENRKRVNNYYSRIYELYTDRFYDKVMLRCAKAKSIFADNHLQDQFDFLAAMAVGHTNTLDAFKQALQGVIINHPKTEVAIEAQRILDLIKKGIKVSAPSKNNIDYTHKFDDDFMMVVVVPNSDKKSNNYKVDISDFNSKYYSKQNFEVSSLFLNPINQLITVKTLKGFDKSKDYYQSFKFNKDNLKSLNDKGYQYFIISNDNFILFYKDKNIKNYYDFFLENFEIEE